jgi:hypothetical protein
MVACTEARHDLQVVDVADDQYREDGDHRTRSDGEEKYEQQGKGSAKVEHLGSLNPRRVVEIPGLPAAE